MKLISSKEVIANVKDVLSSYNESNLIDTSDLYRWMAWVINRLGIEGFVESQEIAKIEKYKVPVPSGLNQLWSVLRCDYCDGDNPSRKIEMSHTIEYLSKNWSNVACTDKCSICRDEDPKIVTETWKIKNKEYFTKYCNRRLLSLAPNINRDKIHEDCQNSNNLSEEQFSLDDKYFYFNFTDCYAHIQYYSFPLDDEGLPMIEDNEYVKKAIEDYLVYKVFQKIFYNGEVDVQTRMQYAEQKSNESLKEALYDKKLDSFVDLVKAAKRRPQYLEIFNLTNASNGGINQFYPRYR